MNAREWLINLRMTWQNDYASVATFAEHNGLTVKEAIALIMIAREVCEHDDLEA